MLNAFGDGRQVAGAELEVAVGHADGERAAEDEEQLVGVGVTVGVELAE